MNAARDGLADMIGIGRPMCVVMMPPHNYCVGWLSYRGLV